MTRRHWTPAELALLASMFPHCHSADVAAWLGRSISSVNAAAYTRNLGKTDEYLASDAAARIKRGQQHPNMIAHRFQPGQKPWNTGTHFVAGGRSAVTRFKPGNRPHTWRPIGDQRVSKDGYLERKVTDDGRGPRDWEAVHRIVWRAANGPIPPAHVVTFRPGRRTLVEHLITPDALELISRAELVQRNHPRARSPELAKLVQLKGAITRQVNRIAREASANHHTTQNTATRQGAAQP